MTEKMKTTAPVSSVGADGAQPNIKKHNEIIANETAQINLQAAQNPEKSRSGGLQTVSMTELYDTVYPPRTPVVDGFLYGGTYLFVGAPKVGKSLRKESKVVQTKKQYGDFSLTALSFASISIFSG